MQSFSDSMTHGPPTSSSGDEPPTETALCPSRPILISAVFPFLF